MGVFYGTKPIVSDGLVLHIDPVNMKSMPESGRTDPLTDSSVTDMSGNISSINIGASKDANDDGVANTWKPEWSSEANGSIRFRSNGVGEYGVDFDYGFLDLGAPVDGVTRFGSTDSYTVELWWRSTELWSSYEYNGGWLLGPEELFSVYPSGYWGREYIWDSFCIGIYKYSGNVVNFNWRAGQMKTSSTSGNPTNAQYYNAIGAQTLNDGETWHHECCVFDLGNTLGGGQKIYTYTDGKLARIGTKTTVGSADWIQNTVAGGHRYIGSSSRNEYDGTASVNGIRSNGANGHMGAFKIYDKALTVNQVKQNYDALRERYGTPPPPPPIQSGNVDFVTSGTYSWEVPESIFSICAVCIGAGGGASVGGGGWSGSGGGGGALSYKNNISVTPGETLTIIVGAGGGGGYTSGLSGGDSQIKRSSTILLEGEGGNGGSYRSSGGAGGQTWSSADGGGDGGNGGTSTQNELFQDAQGGGGGGAGGYSGNGGNGGYGLYSLTSGYMIFPTNGSAGATGSGAAGGGGPSGGTGKGGGGVNIVRKGGTGSSASRNSHGKAGSGGTNSSESVGGSYGGGAGGEDSSGTADDGSGGAIRIIFGDLFTDTRTYPSV
tara:strand:- start:140 stop:1954 length:1815 start_codon:yes stop_codon:yes gene_type:complete